MNIIVIGMGYVGIPCAALLADVPGFSVTGVQRRSERSGWKIDCLNRGRSPFEGDEPGLADLLQRVACDRKSFRVTDDPAVCKSADVILIDVQTPTDGDHVPHYESLREVSAQAGRYLQPGTLVIVESTVAPGTTQNVVQPILERESGLKAGAGDQEIRKQEARVSGSPIPDSPIPAPRFYLAFSYERVMPGRLLEYITDFPRVVGGVDEESTRRAVSLYRNIVKAEITPTDVLTAEMAKVVENAYRDVNIAFANEVALACERMGVNVFKVRELINARPDRHMHIPGAGVGGHCLPKDSWLLRYGLETYGKAGIGESGKQGSGRQGLRIIPLAREINDGMPGQMAALVEDALAGAGRPLEGSRVAVLGVAYLEDADDTRNTPAIPLIRALLERGVDVVAHDPYVRQHDWRLAWNGDSPVRLVHDLQTALEGADCAAVVTKHTSYLELSKQSSGPDRLLELGGWMRTRVIVDGRNILHPEVCTLAGFVYRGIGKGK